VLGIVGKYLARKGALAWFRGIWSYGVKSVKFQSYFLTEKLKTLLFFSMVACFIPSESSQWGGVVGLGLVVFGPMV